MRRFVSKIKNEPQREEIARVRQATGLGEIVSRLMIDRGFDPATFFAEDGFHDPLLLSGMDRAVAAIRRHLEAGSGITIFGDYDVDGVSASAILYLYLQKLGADVRVIIPTRQDGYGLSEALLRRAMEDGSKLVITVDCGISSVNEALFCQENGLELIITDHHQAPRKLPECLAVVDPLLGDYPTPHICGAGVAGKLVQALGGEEAMEEYLDLMAIATIADIVPLTGENRTIVKKGLKKINRSARKGLLALKAVAGIQKDFEVGNIAFGIAPRLNAAGRMATAMDAFHLLIEDDYEKAEGIARSIDITNKMRQKQEEKILEEALSLIQTQVDLKVDRVILLKSRDWNKGIIGIVASKLVEKYHRPVILFSEEDGVLTGSGRSIHGVHLFQLISAAQPLLLRFGGHELAAGMSLSIGNFEKVKRVLQQQLEQSAPAELFVPREYYDLEIAPRDIDLGLVEDLEKLAPMGMGNKTPAFLLRNVRLGGLRLIGEKKNHLRFSLLDGEKNCSGVGFSMGGLLEELEEDGRYDLIVNIERNSWQGRESAQLLLRALRPNVEDNIEGIVRGGAAAFAGSALRLPTPVEKLEGRRMRKMWRGDVYICRRVNKDVFGTAIYSSIPECSRQLLMVLKSEGLLSNLDICLGKPGENTCLVLCPDWSVTQLPFARLILNDYAPSGFVAAVLEKNPGLQVVLCQNEDRERMILEFTGALGLDREVLLRYYRSIRQQLKNPEKIGRLLQRSRQPYLLALVLQVFEELGLVRQADGVLALAEQQEKRELKDSPAYQTMLGLDRRMHREIKILLDHCNKGAKRR